jgi:predicted transcriptional regulator
MTTARPRSVTPVAGGHAEADHERFGLLMSIQPRFADAILAGTKTVELRRRPPREEPDIVIIYSSGKARSVIGVAVLKKVHTSTPADIWCRFGSQAGVTRTEFFQYFDGCELASAVELERPERGGAELSLESLRGFGFEPPQSWRYVDEASACAIVRELDLPSRGASAAGRRGQMRRPIGPVPFALLDQLLGTLTSRLGSPTNRILESAKCVRREAFRVGARVPGRHLGHPNYDL